MSVFLSWWKAFQFARSRSLPPMRFCADGEAPTKRATNLRGPQVRFGEGSGSRGVKYLRSQQGNDSFENPMILCAYCHMGEHGQLFYSVPAAGVCSKPNNHRLNLLFCDSLSRGGHPGIGLGRNPFLSWRW